MATCANCSAAMKYEYKVTQEMSINYCEKHLPRFLQSYKKAGLLTPTPVEVVVEAPKTSKKKAAAADTPTEEVPPSEE